MINGDFNSILFLLMGKESSWTPYIILGFLIFQKWELIEKKIKSIWLINKIQYELTGKMYCNATDAYTYGDLSTHMWSVLYDIHKKIKKNEVIIKKARTVEFPSNQVFDSGEYVNIPADDSKIKLTDTIYCTFQMKNKDIAVQRQENDRSRNKDESLETINLKIVLTSSKSILDIMEYIKNVTDEYEKQIKAKTENQLFIIKPHFINKGCGDSYNGGQEISYPTTIPFKSTKTFDNLFFEGKDTLIKRLDTFVHREKYSSLGLPETLGLLFYGEPGTGKTSAIKAVAHYLQMHLIIVPMNHIKSKKRLEELFFSSKMDDYPQNKRIYVFEEIDCNGWQDIVRDRSLLLKDSNGTSFSTGSSDNVGDAISTAVSAIADSIKNGVNGSEGKSKKKEEDDKLTLGAVLEVIDGLVEAPGRVIIFTTNHKEHLDPALLRPGRIDMQVEFKKLRRSHIADIYKKWYGYPICSKAISDIPDYKFTQAEISQLLFKYETDSDGFINEVGKVRN